MTETVYSLMPGRTIPYFNLPALNVNSEGCSSSEDARSVTWISCTDLMGQGLALIFFPPDSTPQQAATLKAYQARQSELTMRGCRLVGVCPASFAELKCKAAELGLTFTLLSDFDPPGATAAALGWQNPGEHAKTGAILLDGQGIVRRVYDPQQYPHLPNPALISRAALNLLSIPQPPPISEQDWQLGPQDAPITVIVYSDFQCPACIQAHQALHTALKHFAECVRLVSRHLPLRHSHPLAQQAAEAAEAAGAQGRYWEMQHSLFLAGGVLDKEYLLACAVSLGLELDVFSFHLEERAFEAKVNQDFRQAIEAGIKLPPSIFFNGLLYQGPYTADAFCSHLMALLGRTNLTITQKEVEPI